MVLLHLRVELVFEGLHLVIEDDFRKIHLLSYHDLVHADSPSHDPSLEITMINKKL